MKLKINLNEPKIREKVTNDQFGRFVAMEWKRLLTPYTPKDTGILEMSAWVEPWQIEYPQPYAAYVYFGELYVDPDYYVGGFLGSQGWFSRPGVDKIPSGEPLQYQKNNRYATDHWDEKAAAGGQLNKLYRTVNSALRNGNF